MSGTIGGNLSRSSGSITSEGSGVGIILSSGDPSISTNPALGAVFVNTTSGETYICTNATTGSNTWINVGDGSGNIS